jgi:peroxiredoxin
MKYLLFSCLLTSLATWSFGQNSNSYVINGTAKGLADKTVLYLEYIDENKKVTDSALVQNQKFIFTGQLLSKSVNVLLRTSNFDNYNFFWLESSNITFEGEKGKFREAAIIGSATQNEQDRLNKKLRKVSEKEQSKIEQTFVLENPKSIISGHILNVYSSTWGKQKTQKLYDNFTNDLKNTSYGQSISKFLSLNKDVKVGDKYVDFKQTDSKGKEVSLSDIEGKVILLEFWGSWCGPCRQTNHELVKIYSEFKDLGFEIFGVAAETNKSNWLQAIGKDKLTWTNVTDLKGDNNEASLIYGVSGYPTSFLIDSTGVIIAQNLKIKDLRKKLRELLKK